MASENGDSPAIKELSHSWDFLSNEYDDYNESRIVFSYMRNVSLSYLKKFYSKGMSILELGCGTGDEAIHLAKCGIKVFGTDISNEMIKKSIKKAEIENLIESCRFECLPIERISSINEVFDGVYSSFGGLNCIKSLESFAQDIEQLIKTGGYLIISVMNRVSIAENILYSMILKFKTAFRRINKKPLIIKVAGTPFSFECRYYTPKKFFSYFGKNFELIEYRALPLFLIPAKPVELFFFKHSQLFNFIIKLDNFFSKLPFFKSLGDHFLIILKKKLNN